MAQDEDCSQSEQSFASSTSGGSDKIPSSLPQHAESSQKDRHDNTPAHRQEKPSAHDSRADKAYETYKMTAVNKLVNELAHKQQECRKAKLHAVVSLELDKCACNSSSAIAKIPNTCMLLLKVSDRICSMTSQVCLHLVD